jgi:Fur family ferric uptake transcriptional regulator
MCGRCDYPRLLESKGVTATPNRMSLMEIVGDSAAPMSPQEIHEALKGTRRVNRVTVYRILDLLVENGLLERLSSGDRSFRYGLAPNANHRPHPHFFCRQCGAMECLASDSLRLDTRIFERRYPGAVEKVEVRVDGICKNCVKGKGKTG